MKERRTFTSAQKAAIVLSVIKGEKTLMEASKLHNLTPSLIHKWKDHFLSQASTVFDQSKENQEQNRKIKQYEYVISKITTQNDFLEKVLLAVR